MKTQNKKKHHIAINTKAFQPNTILYPIYGSIFDFAGGSEFVTRDHIYLYIKQ